MLLPTGVLELFRRMGLGIWLIESIELPFELVVELNSRDEVIFFLFKGLLGNGSGLAVSIQLNFVIAL